MRLLNPALAAPAKEEKKNDRPTFATFADLFMEVGTTANKPSEVASKERILRVHLKPEFGEKPIDEIGYAEVQAEVQDYVARKLRTLSQKTINNTLTVLRRVLVVAKKRGVITTVPEMEWLRPPAPDFDFFDFEEAERLVAAADEEWRCMILVALRTGLRQGELLALRWQDVDLVKGVIHVRRSVTNGIISEVVGGRRVKRVGQVITDPKSRKGRDVPLGGQVLAALKAHRHLRGELVFCSMAGRMLTKNECKHPIWRARKRAGLRQVGWHVLRHTFASHLAMRGVPLKSVQELMGHATIEMTMRYAHLAPHVNRDAVQQLDLPAISETGLGKPWAEAENDTVSS